MHSLLLLYAEPDGKQGKEDKPEPEANFALSGKLAAESNTVKGVVLVHQEPPEARKPSQMWRLYGFKNGELSSSSFSSSSSRSSLLLCCHSCSASSSYHAARSDLHGRQIGVKPYAAKLRVLMVSMCARLQSCDSLLLSKSASCQELQTSHSTAMTMVLTLWEDHMVL